MSDVKYSAELCERLEREARSQYRAWLVNVDGVSAATMLAMADQLAAARAEIERLTALACSECAAVYRAARGKASKP